MNFKGGNKQSTLVISVYGKGKHSRFSTLGGTGERSKELRSHPGKHCHAEMGAVLIQFTFSNSSQDLGLRKHEEVESIGWKPP